MHIYGLWDYGFKCSQSLQPFFFLIWHVIGPRKLPPIQFVVWWSEIASPNRCIIKTASFIIQGAPVGLHVLEVRDTSVVVLWESPVFNGRTPVNGYYMDVKEAAAGEESWKAVHEKANKVKYLKVRKTKNCFIASSWNLLALYLRSKAQSERVLPVYISIWYKHVKQWILLTIFPFDCLCADSGDRSEGWCILRVPCPCPKSCWSWKALSSLRSNHGPNLPWWVW